MALSDPISLPQINYIKSLIAQKDLSKLNQAQIEFLTPVGSTSEESAFMLDQNLGMMNKGQASDAIKALLACNNLPVVVGPPKVDAPRIGEITGQPDTSGESDEPVQQIIEIPLDDSQPDVVAPVQGLGTKAPDVPQGYFFINDPTETDPDKVEKFFRIRHGKVGTKWEGYVFLDVQASDFFFPVRDPRRRQQIIAEIMKDPIAAMNEYGMRLGRCGVCGRTLTDRHSILRGIGPICAERLGPTTEQTETLRRLGLIKD